MTKDYDPGNRETVEEILDKAVPLRIPQTPGALFLSLLSLATFLAVIAYLLSSILR